MLNQQLTGTPQDMSGKLVVTAAAGALIELQDLAAELSQRPNITTDGSIVVVPPTIPPPPEEEG